MDLPDEAVRRIIENAFRLRQVENALANDATGSIRRLFDEIAAEIARVDPMGVEPMRYRRARVEKLLKRVEELTGESFHTWYLDLRQSLSRIGRSQAVDMQLFLRVSLGEAAGRVRNVQVTQNMMKAILDTDPFRGETLRGWADAQSYNVVTRVRREIQTGMMEELSIDDMVRRIRGRPDGRGGYVGGLMDTTTREATAIVRTAVTEVATRARLKTIQDNAHVLSSVEYVATLDKRTCPICGPMDGKRWPVDSDEITRPPLHWQCRCTLVPVVDWERLGVEPPEGATRAARDPETGKTVQIPISTNYEQWLQDQPAAVQDEILGPTRARLFRLGRIQLDQLISEDRRLLPLDELEQIAERR